MGLPHGIWWPTRETGHSRMNLVAEDGGKQNHEYMRDREKEDCFSVLNGMKFCVNNEHHIDVSFDLYLSQGGSIRCFFVTVSSSKKLIKLGILVQQLIRCSFSRSISWLVGRLVSWSVGRLGGLGQILEISLLLSR